jgi:hypothetical protein
MLEIFAQSLMIASRREPYSAHVSREPLTQKTVQTPRKSWFGLRKAKA